MSSSSWTRPLAFLLVGLLTAACGGGGSGGPGATPTPPPPAPASPTVLETSPANGATQPITGVITVRFSTAVAAATVTAQSFLVSGVTGTVTVSGATATLTPSAPLASAASYTATLTTAIRDLQGRALATDYSWSFETEAPPVPVIDFPLTPGTRWLYDADYESAVVSATGVSSSSFTGRRFVRVAEPTTIGGRQATAIDMFDLEDQPDGDSSLKVQRVFLSNDLNGFWRFVPSGSGGAWRRILSYQQNPFTDVTFWMAGGPNHGNSSTLDNPTVTVPFGTFSALRTSHHFVETGPYAVEDIFEDRFESYADGVGLLRATWDYTFDDNDPQGIDYYADGSIVLTHLNQGPFPEYFTEAAPNSTPPQANFVSPFCVIAGDTLITDPATLSTNPSVQPNENGARLLQDWYRIDVGSGTDLRIDLTYKTSGSASDLDVYFFALQLNGVLFFLGSGTREAGEPEYLERSALPAGTYFVAVQAWRTNAGRVPYWIGLRTDL